MAYPRGAPKPPGSGRKKGTPNKSTQTAAELAASLGVDPFAILLHYANKNYDALGIAPTRTAYNAKGMPYEEDAIPNELAQKSAKDATPYIRPTLKAVEHSGPGGGPISHSWVELARDVVPGEAAEADAEPVEQE